MVEYTASWIARYEKLEASFEEFTSWLRLPFGPAHVELDEGVRFSFIPDYDIVYAQAWVMWRLAFGPPDNQIVWLNCPVRNFDFRPFEVMTERLTEEFGFRFAKKRSGDVVRAENGSFVHLLPMTESSLRGRTITDLVFNGQRSETHIDKILAYAAPAMSFRETKVIRIMPRSEA